MTVYTQSLWDIDPCVHLEVIICGSVRGLIAHLELEGIPVVYLWLNIYHGKTVGWLEKYAAGVAEPLQNGLTP